MKIYAGNLSYEVTEEDLRDTFSEFGNVESVVMIKDRETGRSKGFGFVEMSDSDAKLAIESLNGRELKGRNLNVNEARPMENRKGKGGFGGNKGGYGGNKGGFGGNKGGYGGNKGGYGGGKGGFSGGGNRGNNRGSRGGDR